ncbi:MAG: MFS transporter [Candidatus Eremiobacteraeota bacterium]|nr:MFS transporter [Candidatus Eremiobacteraeota bacterium]
MYVIVAGALQRRDFRLLWGGQFVSDFGRQLTIFAFPTIAILGLHARAEMVSALTGSEYAVIPLFAMVAGVLIDRWRRRHTMIFANLVRFSALASVPLAAAFHTLTMVHLILAAVVISFAGLFFDTAYQPFLASLVGRESYAEGNARMTLSWQVAIALGNALGGPVIHVLGAPLALVGNLLTYCVGTCALLNIRKPEVRVAPAGRSFRREFREGCSIVTRDRVLRSLALTTSVFYLGGTIVDCALPLYVYRTLHQTPLAFGIMLAVAASGCIFGGFVSRVTQRFGAYALLVVAPLCVASGDALCALGILPLVAIVVGRTIVAAAAPAYDMTVQTIATARVEDGYLARMNAALRMMTNASIPLGCFISGVLFTRSGGADVLLIGSLIILSSAGTLALLLREGTKTMCSLSITTRSAQQSAA